MEFVRKIVNSDILANIVDLPESLKNKKVEILILPYENTSSESTTDKVRTARGLLESYKDKELKDLESDAWAKTIELERQCAFLWF